MKIGHGRDGGSRGVRCWPDRRIRRRAACDRSPAQEPGAEAVELPSPGTAEVPPSPGAASSASPTSPVFQNQGNPTAAADLEFASPPSTYSEFVDAYHDGEELRFRRVDDIIGDAELPGLASRLTDPELMLMSAEEPATFAVAERDAN